MKIAQSKAWDFEAAIAKYLNGFSQWSARHPVRAVLLVAAVAIAVNCYPIIFCGRSYVSPVIQVPMVYGSYPTLPGISDTRAVEPHGSDSTAMMDWGVPAGFIESRAILEHGELPLWNRYGHAGDTFIGQAVSMLGDPLQLIVILGHGSAGAWDIKFVLAKFLFCVGFGLLVRRLLTSVPLALIFTALSAYGGAFFYIYNHQAFFVFAYAPWILLSAVELLDVESCRYFTWGIVWLLANFACFNAGHVELGVVLIGGMNLAAFASVLIASRTPGVALRALIRLAIGTALFLALAAPVWLSFLTALPGAWSLHQKVEVVQFHLASLLGIFDDTFFRIPKRTGFIAALGPGTSFLIAVGSIFAMVRWRSLKSEPFFWINNAAIVLWGGCAFGWVPAGLLRFVPMINRTGHTFTDFAYLLNVHLTLQCAFGFRSLAREADFRRVITGLLWTAGILAGIILLFVFGISHQPIPWSYLLPAVAGAFGAPLLFAYLRGTRPAIPFFGLLGIASLAFVPSFRFALYSFGNAKLLMIPGPRVTLNAPSPAIETVKADQSSPFRVTGTDVILFGDYAAVYDLEDIRSCAPLSNAALVDLLQKFPGIQFPAEWIVELEDPVAAHSLLNLLNVKYILAPSFFTVPESSGFRVVNRSDLTVLQNLDVWPRAFFADSVVPVSSENEFIRYLLAHEKPFIAVASNDIKNEPGVSQLFTNPTPAVEAATNYQLHPNSTAFDIHAERAGVVCLTEGQGKDFIATANGAPHGVMTFNRAFKGIYLDKPGDYHIVFTYRPRHWRLACALFWSAIALVPILGAMSRLFSKPKTNLDPRVPDSPVEGG